jgi:hypothetical protein
LTSPKQIEANRQNALRSTGPITPEGKAAVSLNAIQHGVTANTVVIPFLEEEENWKTHWQGMIESLSPSGHLETVLAERIAMLLWRLGRAIRYETELLSLEIEKREEKIIERDLGGQSLVELAEEVDEKSKLLRLLSRFEDMEDDKRIPGAFANSILLGVDAICEVFDISEEELPYVPVEAQIYDYKEWTAGRLREALAVISEREGKSTEELLSSTIYKAAYEQKQAELKIEKGSKKLERMKREGMLAPDQEMEKISRYEAHLDRSLYKAMHELQRMQATRKGQSVPLPVTVDVNLDING